MICPVKSGGDVDENMVYQRICVATADGGVLSLDWPSNLDLEEERGLDTTVLIVPGTAEGSIERKVRVFVCECLRRGVFPVVMNPRGCAGSPLTTARLFTAADSDDISTAVQFISKKRPWTTLMGVGWEYGANMLTKYLAESGERTPLTAATCIDNPFDLVEATRSAVHHMDFDQRHTDGLINILQCNKELFQGRGKGFDVERALSASSTQDFDGAISIVSHGFDTIEDFYAKSSTRDVIDQVKVPVLYIQWLNAVELGLLKGRHPLLKDVDFTINPSKGLALMESRASSKEERVDKLLSFTNGSSTSPQVDVFQANDAGHIKDIGEPPPIIKGVQQDDSDVDNQSIATTEAIVEEGINSFDERGQVLQTAEVVMNMLDMTMPDTLSDEQKKKNTETDGTPNEPLKEKENSKEPSELDEMSEKTQQNIVTSLAEKAMSVASPVVPVKEDGEVDHERILGFVFMVMLLWSPVVLPLLPTLMQSWTTRNPFKIAEFACIAGLYVSIMIMVTLWGKRIRKYDDPLVQYGLDLASVSKLNVLICDLNLWIVADGDEKCPYAFGLDVQRSKNCFVLGAYGGILLGLLCLNPGPCRSLSPTTTTSHVPQRDGSGGKRWFQGFLKGLVGGVVLVILIHGVNTSLGCAHLCWPTTLSSSYSEPVSLIKSYGWMLMLIVQGIATATGVSVVEELLFRSWLPQEIAADFGYHHGIVISGLVFALSQRSIWEIPGLWLLSLSLSGARQRSQGSLSLPIGLRTGILVSNFILRTGGFLTYQPNFPLWLTGGRPFQPFSGVVGLAFSLVLAVILYPSSHCIGKE
ncbi:UNVERIFIED_CONTAM: Embryogenesis-associated protein [Sesamum radiatum]|uniref:Embryogenesis-associated protein n=1 Tax=Sesamum radiatum TaxID=300843 RepID=A0AAW2KPD6_SESRA